MVRERRIVRVALEQHEEPRVALRARELVQLALGLVRPNLLRERLNRTRELLLLARLRLEGCRHRDHEDLLRFEPGFIARLRGAEQSRSAGPRCAMHRDRRR